MHSPRPTVSAARQVFETLRGNKVERMAYGSGPAMMAMKVTRASAARRVTGALASDGAVFTSRCVTRFR